MRCDVLLTQDPKTVYPDTVNTDIEVWREGAAYKKALVSSGPRDVAKYSVKNGLRHLQKSVMQKERAKERCKKSEAPGQLNGNGLYYMLVFRSFKKVNYEYFTVYSIFFQNSVLDL